MNGTTFTAIYDSHKFGYRKRLKISYDNNERLLTITDVYAVIHVSVFISVSNHHSKDDIGPNNGLCVKRVDR